MNTDNNKWSEKKNVAVLKKFLGSLELETMEFMWQLGEATVKQVVGDINRRRPIAYTSVMTVMGHLVGKGLLSRTKEGKSYLYKVAQDRKKYLQSISRKMVRTLVEDFGDIAIAHFLGEVDSIDNGKLTQLRKSGQEAGSERNASK